MAIIQDLPPELLEKVIDYTSVLEAYDKDDVVNPYELATVSKDWLEAGQRVFFQHVELSEERVERFLACAKHRRERTSDLFFVGRLSLPRKPPAKLDQVFKAIHVRRLESRRSEKIPWEDLHSTQVTHLTIATTNPTLPVYPLKTLEITGLTLVANFAYSPPLPSAVRSILEASPAITTLELGWSNGSGEEFENYTQLLCTLAPKLQKLVLCMDDDDDVATDSEQLLRTLTNCTSLRILVFSGTRAHQLAPVVSALPTPLLVLEIFQPTWLADDDTAREWAAALLKASNVPGLKELKGWRVYSEIGVDKKTGNGAAWVAQCEERGIEVRDERKLFTD